MAKIELTKEEVAIMYQILDQVQIRGLENKVQLVSLMSKLAPHLEVSKDDKRTKKS